jgi:hypothetical protein
MDDDPLVDERRSLMTGDRRTPWRTLARICAVGFFINCQPSEPYVCYPRGLFAASTTALDVRK